MLEGSGVSQQQSGQPIPHSAESERQKDFVSVVLGSTEDTWGTLLPKYGMQYEQPKLVLFTGVVQSACGNAQSAMGPFYCPGDHKVYLDLDFFRELEGKLGAGGDFARAYVIGHEIGHHVQNLIGTSSKVHTAQQRSSEADANKLSVLLELQADCYAGVWAHHANQQRDMLENGDIEEAINAAAAVVMIDCKDQPVRQLIRRHSPMVPPRHACNGFKSALSKVTLTLVTPLKIFKPDLA